MYNYREIYNEYWQKFMDECGIESVGIIRKDEDGNDIFGFANVFAEDQSPYDFCARIGYEVIKALQGEDVGSLALSKGSYILVDKT